MRIDRWLGEISWILAGPFAGVLLKQISDMESSGVIHGPPLVEYPGLLAMPKSMPRRWLSMAVCRTRSHHGFVNATTSGVGLLPISPGHGVVVSARLIIIVPPKPASCRASRSFVMESLVRLHPIHIHITCGRASGGGFRKMSSS